MNIATPKHKSTLNMACEIAEPFTDDVTIPEYQRAMLYFGLLVRGFRRYPSYRERLANSTAYTEDV